jgi:uncharacterized protein (DUF924 family)
MVNQGWQNEVNAFWFGELTPDDWFRKDEALDDRIRARFLELHMAVAATPPAAERLDADTAVAAAIVLDQMPRNMFRGTAQAFSTDAAALKVAEAAVDTGLDRGQPPARRLFLYLPFEHAESRESQRLSVELFAALGNPHWLDYAQRHQVIIDRFGRFPHRNVVLGRASTDAELKFLQQPDSSF